MFEERITRRDALKKAAYMTPVILTFLAAPSFASGGSGRDERHEEDERDEEYEGEGKEVAVAAMEKEEGGGSGIMKETKDVIKSNLAGGSKRAKVRRNSPVLVESQALHKRIQIGHSAINEHHRLVSF